MPKQETITSSEFQSQVKQKTKRPAKYRNQIIVVDGEKFHSKKEYAHWVHLKQLQSDGVIHDLKRQVPFEFIHNGFKIGKFTADMAYYITANNQYIVSDVKSPITKMETSYRLRRKMMIAFFGIEVTEV